MSKRLTENHPLSNKVRKLEDIMNDMKITLDWDGYHLNIIDAETNVSARYRDEENRDIREFPSWIEARLVID